MRVLLENLRVSIEQFEKTLPPDEEDDDLDEDLEPESLEFKRYKRQVNKLRRELRVLRQNR